MLRSFAYVVTLGAVLLTTSFLSLVFLNSELVPDHIRNDWAQRLSSSMDWITSYKGGSSGSRLNLDNVTEVLDLRPDVDPFEVESGEPESAVPLLETADDAERRVRATLLSLVRNSEAQEMAVSVRQVHKVFNNKFRYPWTFFNDEPFSDQFKELMRAAAGDETELNFVQISAANWEEPAHIDKDKAAELMSQLKDHVQYADLPSYHRMCRWNSGLFYEETALAEYDYYWRVEPKTQYFCDIDYDVFDYMHTNNKTYGFVINLYDTPESVATLWPTAKEFFLQHPSYVNDNNALQWLVQDSRPDHNALTQGYSTCHFWSNFEIGKLSFFRSPAYRQYFEHLDKAGGFFYERWGDAPVHSIALALMLDKRQIHWFQDIGYLHFPYYNCPNNPKCNNCRAGYFSQYDNLEVENCLGEWFKVDGVI